MTTTISTSVEPSTSVSIGLDIGGTKTLGVLISSQDTPMHAAVRKTATGNDGVVQTATEVIRDLLEKSSIGKDSVCGIGVGIPGVVDQGTGEVHNAVNLGITTLPLKRDLEENLGITVDVANDVNAAALGAAHELRLQGSVAYLNIGTGMAACLVKDGQIYRGTSGAAGEIGHLPVDPGGVRCGCGQVGCLETIASGSALSRQWPADGDHPSDALLAAKLAGDPAASEVFRSFANGVCQAVKILVLTYDPEVVVLGGGMRKLGAPLFEEVDRVFGRWAEESAFIASLNLKDRLMILPPESNAGATGAALLTGMH